MKGGKNSNNADAQGESWEEMLSAETPSLSNPWISWEKNLQLFQYESKFSTSKGEVHFE